MTTSATPPQLIDIANIEAPSASSTLMETAATVPTAAPAAAAAVATTAAPTPPAKPGPDECCGTGCIPCVMDIYEEQLWQYEKDLQVWQAAQPLPNALNAL